MLIWNCSQLFILQDAFSVIPICRISTCLSMKPCSKDPYRLILPVMPLQVQIKFSIVLPACFSTKPASYCPDLHSNINTLKPQHIKNPCCHPNMKIKHKENKPDFKNTRGKDTTWAEMFLVSLMVDRNIPICVNTALVNRAANPYIDKCHMLTSVPEQPNQSTAFIYF